MTPEEQAVLAAHDAERRRALEERDAALAKLDQMRKLHRREIDDDGPYCRQCCGPFPCPTVRILDGEAQS